MPDPLAPRGAQVEPAPGNGCLGAARFLVLWAIFVAGVAVGVLASWAWRAWL